MSSTILKTCCVCGKETGSRCSACAAAGIELFFCSPEHQKLVWKGAHSKVCGSKAHPFIWPELVPAKVELIRQYKELEPHKVGPLFNPQLDAHRKRHGLSTTQTEQFPSVAGALTRLVGRPEQEFDQVVVPLLHYDAGFDVINRMKLRCTARSLMRTILELEPSTPPSIAALSLFYTLLRVENHVYSRFPNIDGSIGLSRLLHRGLILFQLIHLKTKAPSTANFQQAFAYHALQAYLATACEVLPFSNPEEFRVSLDVLSKLAEPALQFEKRYGFDANGRHVINIHPYPF